MPHCLLASAWCHTTPCGADCWMATMSEPRPIQSIDAQIDILRGLNADADDQLTSIRRQQGELERHELSVLSAIDGRLRRIDLLLDERLRAAETEQVTA